MTDPTQTVITEIIQRFRWKFMIARYGRVINRGGAGPRTCAGGGPGRPCPSRKTIPPTHLRFGSCNRAALVEAGDDFDRGPAQKPDDYPG